MGLKKFLKVFTRDLVAALIVGAISGAIIVLAIRFINYKTPSVHYHANFAVYINGQQEQFKAPVYYEEEAQTSCAITAETENDPIERAHMHDNEAGLVHVHDNAVTWGNFFTNIGWTVNSKLIQTRTTIYLPDKSHPINFILNGQKVLEISNRVIGDTDRLLVDYGSNNLSNEYKKVPANAREEDMSTDPKSCGGSAPTTTNERFHHLF